MPFSSPQVQKLRAIGLEELRKAGCRCAHTTTTHKRRTDVPWGYVCPECGRRVELDPKAAIENAHSAQE